MKRRDLIATALTAPPMRLTGCANLDTPATGAGPAQAQITVLFDAFGSAPGLTKDWGYADFRLIDKTTELAPGIHVISLVSDKPGTLELRELSLALATPQGLVLVVGCSHPGIDRIVEAATKIDPRVHLIAGGLHLVVSKDEDIAKIVDTLRNSYKVAYVAPGHCTGEPSFEALNKAFAERYLYAGVGTRLTLGTTPRRVASRAAGQPPPSATLRDDELRGYRALAAANDQRRRSLFARLMPSDLPDGAYLGQWRRSLAACC